jgi:hypothetical protein
MKSFSRLIILINFIFIPFIIQAQEAHDNHDDKRNELGAAVGVVFDLEEHHSASGLHLHYMRMLGGKMHNFGIAPGLEFIFGEHKHYTLHLLFIYRPAHGWWLGAGPGYTYYNQEKKFGFSGHIETGYEFDAGSVHFGPVVEYSWASENQHFLVGLHLGVPF